MLRYFDAYASPAAGPVACQFSCERILSRLPTVAAWQSVE